MPIKLLLYEMVYQMILCFAVRNEKKMRNCQFSLHAATGNLSMIRFKRLKVEAVNCVKLDFLQTERNVLGISCSPRLTTIYAG